MPRLSRRPDDRERRWRAGGAARWDGRIARLQEACERVDRRWWDVSLAAVLALAGVLGLLDPGTEPEGEPISAGLVLTLVALETVPLVWRRRFPLPVLAVVLTAASMTWLVGYTDIRSDLAAPAAFYSVASRLQPRHTLPAAGGVVLSVLVLTLAGRVDADTFLVLQVIYGGAWAIGDMVRRRGERIVALRRHSAEVQRVQERQIRQAVVEERVRIAQELHDLTAHVLGVIAIQAQAAKQSFVRRPEQARVALSAIQELTDEALVDLRKLLGLLRSDGDDLQARRPQPTLDGLESLAEGFRQAGLPVEVRVEGERRRLSAALETSAYRVVQEALTNTLKHAGPARAVVVLRYTLSHLEVDVLDTGGGTRDGVRPGNGLTGMRERLSMFGGALTYGSSDPGGFVVAARFPLVEVGAA